MSKIIYSILWGLIYMASWLPMKFFYFISDIAAFLLNYVFRYRRSTIEINLARSFPDLKYEEFGVIRKQYYEYMCDIAFESIWAVTASRKQLCCMVTLKNPEVMDRICAGHSKVIAVMGHCGNWELIGTICGESSVRPPESFADHNIFLTYKAAQNPAFDRLFLKMRMHEYAKFGNKGGVVESRRIIRHVLRDKLERNLYIFIADQSPLGERIPAFFLNQPTLMLSGPEYVAIKMNMPVVYLSMQRIKRGKYVIKFIPITDQAGQTGRGFVTREYARLLGEDIAANKYNWLWSHKRWKRAFESHEWEEYDLYMKMKQKEEL